MLTISEVERIEAIFATYVQHHSIRFDEFVEIGQVLDTNVPARLNSGAKIR